MRVRRAGDAALLVAADGRADALAAAIVSQHYDGVLDVVPGADTVLITTEPGRADLAELAERVAALTPPAAEPGAAALAEIPVVYDGPDLAEVARLTGLSPAEVVARHAAAEYRVGWLGFSPGLGYLTGLDPALTAVPRLADPRVRVPAGSVAIAGGLATVYPTASPGGWRLLGRTSAVLWDADRDPPAMLSPGMRVRFRPVDALPTGLAGAPSATSAGEGVRPGRPTGQEIGPGAAGAAVEVVRPGLLATVQDLGRPGYAHLGVPFSGAADQASLRLANRLVGNPDGAAGLELTLGRAVLRFTDGTRVAVTGATAPVAVTGSHGTDLAAEAGAPLDVPADGQLRIGAPAAGLRTYVAVHGGVDAAPVLGSRSADVRSGLGPAPLRPGDLLPVGAPGPAPAGPRPAEPRPAEPQPAEPRPLPGSGQPAELRVIPGPRDDWFAPGALDLLCGGTYVVSPASDRTGLRLDGPALPRAHGDELPSEGMVTGSLQVPPGGRPILLLADHPVTGGYPVIAVVASADIGLAAQLRPGSKIKFVRTAG
ncbi:MAG TPA: 5-oxoprolinase/urea amidolyase family protein [Streptosporangiaceae bacterium]|nr:5-oxoprolinase/urea amidolyase family protein [Streptosporangiaceae bacterium]